MAVDDDNVLSFPVREPEDAGSAMHQAALSRLEVCYDLLEQENNGIEIKWDETEAMAPFDGCQDCVVREVLHAGIGVLTERGLL